MSEFTLDDLRTALRRCAGEDPAIDLDGDIADVPFDALGYDSLALMETTSHLIRVLGAPLPEEELGLVSTPGEFVSVVNQQLTEAAA